MKILVNMKHLEGMNVQAAEFDPDVAIVEAPNITDDKFQVVTLGGVLGSITETEHAETQDILVLKNESGCCGAAAVLDPEIRREVLKRFRACACYILPSSVHEVLAVPADNDHDPEKMAQMVQSINRTELEPHDVLSDHVYRMTADGLTIAG